MLETVEHPFILKLVTAFVDAESYYLLTELILGGDLLAALEELGVLSREPAQSAAGFPVPGVASAAF